VNGFPATWLPIGVPGVCDEEMSKWSRGPGVTVTAASLPVRLNGVVPSNVIDPSAAVAHV